MVSKLGLGGFMGTSKTGFTRRHYLFEPSGKNKWPHAFLQTMEMLKRYISFLCWDTVVMVRLGLGTITNCLGFGKVHGLS